MTAHFQNPSGAAAPKPLAGSQPGWLRRLRRGTRLGGLLVVLLAFFPTLFAAGYYGFFASPRYVSETTFVVRSSTRSSLGGISALFRLVGVSTARDDAFAVHDFIASRDAIAQLQDKIDLKQVYGREGIDRLSRYPSILFGATDDEFQKYLRNRLIVIYNPNTGISRLQVHAFTPTDAQIISAQLIELGEQLINRMNARIHNDAVKFAVAEVEALETRLRQNQTAITEFRNRELQIDPNRSSILVSELVAKLSEEMSRVSAQIAETVASAPNSPQAPSLQRRVDALREQIALERGRIANGSDGLAQKIAQYEELILDRDLSGKALSAAITSLDDARSEARRQQLYLERISGPTLPDRAMMPERLLDALTIFGLNLILVLIIWLMRTGVSEHAPRLKDEQ